VPVGLVPIFMMEIMPMNEFFCKLTGGHRYADINLHVSCKDAVWTIKNRCIKCGKEWQGRLHGSAWLNQMNKEKKL